MLLLLLCRSLARYRIRLLRTHRRERYDCACVSVAARLVNTNVKYANTSRRTANASTRDLPPSATPTIVLLLLLLLLLISIILHTRNAYLLLNKRYYRYVNILFKDDDDDYGVGRCRCRKQKMKYVRRKYV